MPAKVGILAGTGPLPRLLIDACRAQGRAVFVITFEGENLNVDIGEVSHTCVHLGKVGTILSRLKEEECKEVAMAGHFQRPAYNDLKLDLKAARLIPKLIRAKGDDALLRILAGVLEQEGFKVVGAETLLPDLQIGPGTLGSITPTTEHEADISTARSLLRLLGPYDIGQAVIVRRMRVLGIEGPEGTDGLIDRCSGIDGEMGGVLVKMRKPGQDNRVDLPSIGLETVHRCLAAHLSGIAVEAHAALVMDKNALSRKADAHGFFVTAFVEEQTPDVPCRR